MEKTVNGVAESPDHPKAEHSLIGYYSTVYRMRGSVWGQSASELAREAAAVAKIRHSGENEIHVLDLGCGAGRDTLFFATLGWRVTALDMNSEALERLQQDAQALGVLDRIEIQCGSFLDLKVSRPFDLVVSNYSLHFMGALDRTKLLKKLKEATRAGGIHAILAIKDMNEEYVGDLKDYRYLRSRELTSLYADWDLIENYEGMVPDCHPGVPPHEHNIVEVLAIRPSAPRGSVSGFWIQPIGFAMFAGALMGLLSTLGYIPYYSHVPAFAKVWPGSIFQGLIAAAFGGWGILATVLAGVFANAVNVGTTIAVLGFIPANLVQTFIPAWYYRRALKSGGWTKSNTSLVKFSLCGILIPNLLGALLGTLALYSFNLNSIIDPGFWNVALNWALANVPLALLLGVPLFKFLMPSLIAEGVAIHGWWR